MDLKFQMEFENYNFVWACESLFKYKIFWRDFLFKKWEELTYYFSKRLYMLYHLN